MLKGVVVILKELKIPEATVSRLSVYSRYLTEVAKQEIVSISSGEIAEGVGGTPAQVRKDLAYFGEFGKINSKVKVELTMFPERTSNMESQPIGQR